MDFLLAYTPLISSLAAATAAIFAGTALWQNKLEARKQAAFDHLRVIDGRLLSVWSFQGGDVRKELLGYYKHDHNAFSENCQNYLALLNSLDLVALARENKTVSRKIVDSYLASLLRSDTIDPGFIREMQDELSDSQLYSHLLKWTSRARALK